MQRSRRERDLTARKGLPLRDEAGGFRALAHIVGHHCELRSHNGHTFRHWPQLCEEVAHAIKAHDAIIDGEIVSIGEAAATSRTLLFRRDWPYFYAFDLLAVDGEDLREWPLIERKRRLHQLIPSVPTRLLYVDHIKARGRDFFTVTCAHDLEGIVAKLATGRYHSDGASTNWIDQESSLHADDRSARALRAPTTISEQTSASAARFVRPSLRADAMRRSRTTATISPEVFDQHQVGA